MKALEILKRLQNSDYFDRSKLKLSKEYTLDSAIAELEEAIKPKRCDGCGYGKTTINSVICGKNGTYKEADDYCKYYNPKEQ